MIKMHIYVHCLAEHASVLFISGILDANWETSTSHMRIDLGKDKSKKFFGILFLKFFCD